MTNKKTLTTYLLLSNIEAFLQAHIVSDSDYNSDIMDLWEATLMLLRKIERENKGLKYDPIGFSKGGENGRS